MPASQRITGLSAISLLGFIAVSYGEFRTKRFVGGQWKTTEDSQGRNVLLSGLKEQAQHEFSRTTYSNCSEARIPAHVTRSKVVNLVVPVVGTTKVYCDYTTDDGDWIVFQRRRDGSENFFRGWDDYVNGFGKITEEFWLGLEAIHQLTQEGQWEMRTELVTTTGVRYYVKYEDFRIGSASDYYRLHVSGFSGNGTNSISTVHNGQRFSTKDRDNDSNPSHNCAILCHGAWWYNYCNNVYSNLNGNYGLQSIDGISWKTKYRWQYMKYTEMKMRKRSHEIRLGEISLLR